jgi:hypothetical protein
MAYCRAPASTPNLTWGARLRRSENKTLSRQLVRTQRRAVFEVTDKLTDVRSPNKRGSKPELRSCKLFSAHEAAGGATEKQRLIRRSPLPPLTRLGRMNTGYARRAIATAVLLLAQSAPAPALASSARQGHPVRASRFDRPSFKSEQAGNTGAPMRRSHQRTAW